MPDQEPDDDFEAPAPSGAGELIARKSSEKIGLGAPPRPSIPELPSGIIAGDETDAAAMRAMVERSYRSCPQLHMRVKWVSYVVYTRIQFRAWTTNFEGAPYPVDTIELQMDTGHGWFSKSKHDTNLLKYTEEKWGPIGSVPHIILVAKASKKIKREIGTSDWSAVGEVREMDP